MIVTDLIKKLCSDYEVSCLQVNHSLKYSFGYNGYLTDIFYTKQDNMQNQLLVAIEVDGITYLSTLYFSKDENENYQMKYYLPPELYDNVKFSLLYIASEKKCPVTPYFNQMHNCIMNTQPEAVNARQNINGRNVHRYGRPEDNPFFETIIRKPMSDDMKEKVWKKYSTAVAKQIFKFCGATKTLRFTSDITRAQDILTFIE